MRRRNPRLWLLLIPLAVIISIAIIVAGIAWEANMWEKAASQPEVQGHGVPVSWLFTVPASIIIFLILTIVGIVKSSRGVKRQKKLEQEARAADAPKEGKYKDLPPEWQ